MLKKFLSKEIKEFIDANIRSLEDLEILLLVHSDPKHDWDALEVSRKLSIDPILASNHLMALYLNGLIKHEGRGQLTHFRYNTHQHTNEKHLSELEELFSKHRSEVVEYIDTNRRHQIQASSETFGQKKAGRTV